MQPSSRYPSFSSAQTLATAPQGTLVMTPEERAGRSKLGELVISNGDPNGMLVLPPIARKS
jgi:hypothetical protein